MTDNWDRTFFDKELKSILDSKLPVSASKITSLQQLATSHPKHHNYIIQCITKFIESAPPDYRLAGLYVIDAISRAVHKQLRRREENNEKGSFEAEGYLKRFAIVLKDDSLIGCFESCSTKDKDKVKKTLDFWEQGSIYPKEVVQYVKDSFLKQMSPPVDTAALLATLSNIGNLNIPGLTSNNNNSSSISNSSTSSNSSSGSYTTPITNTSTTTTTTNATTTAAPVTQQVNKDLSLPPALAKLLGSLVTTPTPASTSAQVQAPITNTPAQVRLDPRLAASESKTKPSIWPPPQGPSVPLANVGRTEKKSRWGNDTDNIANKTTTTTTTSPVTVTPHTTHTTSTITANSSAQEPWLHRQMTQTANNNSNNNINNAPIYQQMNQQLYQQQYQQYYQQQYQYYQQQQQQQQQQQPLQQIQYKGAQPMSDTSLPPGCIRVLTRTLFVGPIPDHYEREDVARLFAKYGEIASVIVSKKLKGRHNAFLKFTTRAATEAAKYDGAGLMVEGMPVKVNWGFGFGPKKHFNYDRGDSIIPLAELSAEEKDNLVIARVGGFQGQPVRDRMVIEEPEAEYKPEWKDDERGVKRYNNQFEDNRKRTRH
ncbi:hypothetical protein RMATCC62417_08255 [Rhizopus microsporus]|nr:hypothetical protein RMATCC62417_08255 [Rhizopus microsporus]